MSKIQKPNHLKHDFNNRTYRNSNATLAKVPLTTETKDIIGNNDVILSKDGETITLNGITLEQTLDCFGYKKVNIPGMKTIGVHRLMCLAWIGLPPKSPDKWLVNHIDGIKDNNHIDNLEWASYSDNIIHAYQNNLRYDNRVLLLKDIETQEVKEFYSLQECARYLGVNGGLIHFYLKDKSKIRKGKYLLIDKGEEWPELSEKNVEDSKRLLDSYPIKVTNNDTGEFVVYPYMGAAARELGVHPVFIQRRISGFTKGTREGSKYPNYTFEKLTSKEDIEKYRERHPSGNFATPRKPYRILVKNLKTGEEKEWESVEKFASHVHSTKNAIQKSVWKYGVWRDYKIDYLDLDLDRSDIDNRRKEFYKNKSNLNKG